MVRDKLFKISPYTGFDLTLHPADLQGWGSDSPLLIDAIRSLRPRLICEVGSWKGRSAINMARAIKELGLDTEIVCVDTWLGSPEHWLTRDDPNFYDSLRIAHGIPLLYYTFLSNVIANHCADIITPFPTTSENAAVVFQKLGIRFDMVYVDAAHEYDSVMRDVRFYYDLLSDPGLLIGDDYIYWGDLTRAVDDFVKGNNLCVWTEPGKFAIPKGSPKIQLAFRAQPPAASATPAMTNSGGQVLAHKLTTDRWLYHAIMAELNREFRNREYPSFFVSTSNSLQEHSIRVEWDFTEFIIYLNSDVFSGPVKQEWLIWRAFIMGSALSSLSLPKSGHATICLSDWGTSGALSFCHDQPQTILIPDAQYIYDLGYRRYRDGVRQRWIPWEDRSPVAFWRGGANGVVTREVGKSLGWSWLPRAHLCDMATHLSGIDAKLTEIPPYLSNHYGPYMVGVERFMGERVEPLSYIKYRYLIDIDGWTNAWSGFLQKMLTGSTVIKVASPHGYRQWYYDRLEPWKHFVPVNSDLSDLPEALEFVQTNPQKAAEIGRCGKEVADTLTMANEMPVLAQAASLFHD
jgi:hypothetical protein